MQTYAGAGWRGRYSTEMVQSSKKALLQRPLIDLTEKLITERERES